MRLVHNSGFSQGFLAHRNWCCQSGADNASQPSCARRPGPPAPAEAASSTARASDFTQHSTCRALCSRTSRSLRAVGRLTMHMYPCCAGHQCLMVRACGFMGAGWLLTRTSRWRWKAQPPVQLHLLPPIRQITTGTERMSRLKRLMNNDAVEGAQYNSRRHGRQICSQGVTPSTCFRQH